MLAIPACRVLIIFACKLIDENTNLLVAILQLFVNAAVWSLTNGVILEGCNIYCK